ncbi:MAG: esterase/lipase superfamily enzyme [Enterobacterales bacterium]|jgi:esterase/lipase superfamily enzyme
MVTNRRIRNGNYSDEEQNNKRFDYLYDYAFPVKKSLDDNKILGGNNHATNRNQFLKKGKKGFEVALFSELKRLQSIGISTPKVGIYIHGFNNDYQESIDELFDLEKELTLVNSYPPLLIGFSWPSSGNVAYYLSDREEARDSVGAFTRFLLDINNLAINNEQDCFSTSYCIAHSMGNYLLRKGMEYLSDTLGSPTGRKLFDETILIAPDLSSKDIELDGKGSYIADFSRRVHVYYSKHDRALKASSIKRFGGKRLGRQGAINYQNLKDNIVVIDAEKYANKVAVKGKIDRQGEQISVHNSHRYQKNILEDIIQVISSIDREQICGREVVENEQPQQNNHYRLL